MPVAHPPLCIPISFKPSSNSHEHLLTPLAQSSLPPYHCLPTKPPTSNPSSPPPFQISNTNSQNPPTFQNNTQHIYPPHLPYQLIHIPLPTPTHLPPFPRPSQHRPPTPTPASKTPHQTFNKPAIATPSIASMELQPGPRRRNRYVARGIGGGFFPDTAPTVLHGAGMICEVARARSERDRGKERM